MQPRIYQLCKSGNCAEMKKPNVCNLWIGIGIWIPNEFSFGTAWCSSFVYSFLVSSIYTWCAEDLLWICLHWYFSLVRQISWSENRTFYSSWFFKPRWFLHFPKLFVTIDRSPPANRTISPDGIRQKLQKLFLPGRNPDSHLQHWRGAALLRQTQRDLPQEGEEPQRRVGLGRQHRQLHPVRRGDRWFKESETNFMFRWRSVTMQHSQRTLAETDM